MLCLWVLGLTVFHINESNSCILMSLEHLLIMTSMQYYCTLGLSEIKTLHPRAWETKLSAKDAGCAGNKITAPMRGSRNEFSSGRVQVTLTKKSPDVFFFSPQLILQKSMVNFKESKKTIIFHGSRGGPTFCRGGGSNFFQGGPIAYFL